APSLITTYNANGDSGTVKLVANNPSGLVINDIVTSSQTGSGGTINISNPLGSVTLTKNLSTSGSGLTARSGDIIIYAGRYVTEGAVNAGGVSLTSSGLNGSQAGTIALDAAGAVTSGALSATASGPLSLGGNIFIVAGRNASLGVVNASGLELSA